MDFSGLTKSAAVRGLVAGEAVQVLAANSITEDLFLILYQRANGHQGNTYLTKQQIEELTLEESPIASTFSANASDFKLALEAQRMKLAGLFDPLVAVNSSNLEPLPHQISAVYQEFLPRIPLRFLLADDPGAGKTIMAGLYIKELLLRGYLKRSLIVVPGGLIDQWRQELYEKFSLNFEILTKNDLDNLNFVNPFTTKNFLIARMDQLSRATDLVEEALDESTWDLVIIDESHRMSAHYSSWKGEPKQTKRFRLGKKLSKLATNLLLMTATPHAGNEEDFQLFLSLLDQDRFEGKYRKDFHKSDTSDVMRRLVKEKLVTLEGKPLFPERKAITVSFELSQPELGLYEAVTEYVRKEMNRADKIAQNGNKKRRNNIGFALTVLQRRLVSSPRAILRSLERRESRLSEILNSGLNDLAINSTISALNIDIPEIELHDEFDEELSPEEQESLEEADAIDLMTASQTQQELQIELAAVRALVKKAKEVEEAQTDTKWHQLKTILQDTEKLDPEALSNQRKFIVFTEHRDTLNYLKEKIEGLLGNAGSVVSIHGGHSREERLKAKEAFTQDPNVKVLVATDAAGEGLNLQRAHLMVNYDLPWNPNRIEQRFGRIHRIGQTEVCWLWNIIAANTREGEVFNTLLSKIDQQSHAYNGNLFNVLGQGAPFNDKSLRDLLLEAILYGNDPAVKAQLDHVIQEGVAEGQKEILAEKALFAAIASDFDPTEVAKQFEAVQIRRLQPGFISGFFKPAFERAAGSLKARESGRYEISKVPESLLKIASKNLEVGPLASAYERVTFDRKNIHPVGQIPAHLIAPGSPLMNAIVEKTISDLGYALKEGSILIDRTSKQRNEPAAMFAVVQEISNSSFPAVTVDRHFDFIEVTGTGVVEITNTAPYIDYSEPSAEELEFIKSHLLGSFMGKDLAHIAKTKSVEKLIKEDLPVVKARVSKQVEKIRRQVIERLDGEIAYWGAQVSAASHDKTAVKREVQQNPAKKAIELTQRKAERLSELLLEESLNIGIPRIVATALVIPESLLQTPVAIAHTKDQEAIKRIERRAVDLVISQETKRGWEPEEQPRNNKGFDIISRAPDGNSIFIEVKGRIQGAADFIVTASELSFGQTHGTNHILALVSVSPEDQSQDQARYVYDAFKDLSADAKIAAVTLKWDSYWALGQNPDS